MIEWRVGRGWTETELEERLEALKGLNRNFPETIGYMTTEHGWEQYHSEAVIARETTGSPEVNGPFERGQVAVENYKFSDPRIVIGHFDPEVPLEGRHMLLEIRPFRILHFLGGVVISAVRSEIRTEKSVFGFRYDTLKGHLERGVEWFLLTKDHETGEIRFRIEAIWGTGDFPNWWSSLGFSLFGRPYQRIWHERAHQRLARLVHQPAVDQPAPENGRLVHTELDISFTRRRSRNG